MGASKIVQRLGFALACALSPIACHAADVVELAGGRYASAEQCAEVLQELNSAPETDEGALTLATQICYVSRLTDYVAREIVQQTEGGAALSDPRSLETKDIEPSRGDELASSLERARDVRDKVIEDFVQSDAHEANDLLKRLLGPGNDKK